MPKKAIGSIMSTGLELQKVGVRCHVGVLGIERMSSERAVFFTPSHLSSPKKISFYGFLHLLACSISGISERPRKRHSSRDTHWTLCVHSRRYGGYSSHLTPEHGLTLIQEIDFAFYSIGFKFKIKSRYFTCGKL